MLNSFDTKTTISIKEKDYQYYSLKILEAAFPNINKLPFSLKILLENMLRFEDGKTVTREDISAFSEWLEHKSSTREIAFRPTRVLMQDFTGVPAVVDLATMREAMISLNGDPQQINPLSPVDLVIDHSVMVDHYGEPQSFEENVALEFERNKERYSFLKWGQKAFSRFNVVPPGTGICHQVNLEYLAQTVWLDEGQTIFPDTLVGTDSHTTMVNGLSVLGWGVGGIEAEAAMLGQPISMLIPEVVGFKLKGSLKEGTTATDVVLTITQMLRKKGVVGKFVEFYGPGLRNLSLADRATIANMAPEYGATIGFFPIDEETLRYLRLTGREETRIAIVEAYAKAQGLWAEDNHEPVFSETLELDISEVVPSLAGPKRPQDRVSLQDVSFEFKKSMTSLGGDFEREVKLDKYHATLKDGALVIAAITSCTNTSNPSVMLAAGLVAKKAIEKGLHVKPWVKTSLAPGSQVVTDYLEQSGLQHYLDQAGFNLVGYGCTTCIGNSGPLNEDISNAIEKNDMVVAAILSGNRNFEGRIHPLVKANYLASPPLVVAYAFAGAITVDLYNDPLGVNDKGEAIYLKDIWPSNQEIHEMVSNIVTREMFISRYKNVFSGDKRWQAITTMPSETYNWQDESTYVKRAPFFEGFSQKPEHITNIVNAKVLAVFGDSVTTDHISPAGSIKKQSPAGQYLIAHQISLSDFNSFGARRGNHEVMVRGTFGNIRIRNELLPDTEGGITRHFPSEEVLSIFDAAQKYQEEHVPLVIFAGKEYGTGSSRDWAAKGTKLLGIKAVIAESFERIHRSNLVGMGVLPLQFTEGVTRKDLHLTGHEIIHIKGLEHHLAPRMHVSCQIVYPSGEEKNINLLARIDTLDEIEYYRHGGILAYVVRQMLSNHSKAA